MLDIAVAEFTRGIHHCIAHIENEQDGDNQHQNAYDGIVQVLFILNG